jgi:hypothetical protein
LDFNLTGSAATSILDSSLSSTENLLELAATANLKLLTDKYFISPILLLVRYSVLVLITGHLYRWE